MDGSLNGRVLPRHRRSFPDTQCRGAVPDAQGHGLAGVDGWAWLPEDSQFKTYERQLVWSKLTAGLVAIAGLVFLGLFPWQR